MSGLGMESTRVRRVRCWAAVCECGWRGPTRSTRREAEADETAHVCDLTP